jgi:hypothetical protein
VDKKFKIGKALFKNAINRCIEIGLFIPNRHDDADRWAMLIPWRYLEAPHGRDYMNACEDTQTLKLNCTLAK